MSETATTQTHPEPTKELAHRVAVLESLCSEAYLTLLGGRMPEGLLDRLDDAASGLPLEDKEGDR